MLEQLNITDYALIDRMNVTFSSGFNVLTGETGAGKSILVGALGLLLGQKGDPSVIRSGSDETFVSGTVRIEGNPEAKSWLKDRGVEPEENVVILRRVLKKRDGVPFS